MAEKETFGWFTREDRRVGRSRANQVSAHLLKGDVTKSLCGRSSDKWHPALAPAKRCKKCRDKYIKMTAR